MTQPSSPSPLNTMTYRFPHWWVMVSVILVAFAIHTHHLDQTSLWADEGWTIAASAETNPLEVINQWVRVDVHPPLYFILLSLWRQMSGDSIFAMRYFAVLITTVGVALMYRLGKSAFSSQVGFIAAIIFALHDLVHVLTQEVRHYSLQLTLTVFAMWVYWRFWRKPTRTRGIVFAIGSTALLWTHYWGGLVLLSLGIHALITRRQFLRQFMIAYLAIGILFAPWLPSLYHQITLERPGGLPHALENSWIVYKTLVFQLVGVPEAFWLILGLFGILGFLTPHRSKLHWPTPASIFPILIIVLTVGISLLLNTQYPSLSFRSLAVVIPAIALLVAHTLAQFQRREQSIMLVFILVHGLTTTSAQPVERAPWIDLSTFVADHTAPNELILLELGTDDYALAYYLDQSPYELNYVYTETERKTLNDPAQFQNYLDKALAGYDAVWIPKFDWPFYDIRGDLAQRGFVETSTPIFWEFYVDGRPIQLWRMERPPAAPLATFYQDDQDRLQIYRVNTFMRDNTLNINALWYSVEKPNQLYTISTFLLDETGFPLFDGKGNLLVQYDGYPTFETLYYDDETNLLGRPALDYPPRHYQFSIEYSTLQWEATRFYTDNRQLDLSGLPAGKYQVAFKVYFRDNNGIHDLNVRDATSGTAVGTYIILTSFEIE